mmetsp:Transcript_68782/g.118061  ORF Transcript_68782/g.118061 Transcript_68782/m.118061 type:complete len:152 (+) Transcript_68782:227-682(+)
MLELMELSKHRRRRTDNYKGLQYAYCLLASSFLSSERRHRQASVLPRIECTVADTAPGKAIAEAGTPAMHATEVAEPAANARRARTVARAEFCIPVSMATVRQIGTFNPLTRAEAYPSANPPECIVATAATSESKENVPPPPTAPSSKPAF